MGIDVHLHAIFRFCAVDVIREKRKLVKLLSIAALPGGCPLELKK